MRYFLGWILVVTSLWLPPSFGIDDSQFQMALQGCLKGRCEWGETDPEKMPHYDLGKGYICDAVRLRSYDHCLGEKKEEKNCLKLANSDWEACFIKPCPHLNRHCLALKCSQSMNDWDCWKTKKGGGLLFGFETINDKGETEFIPVKSKTVPDELWHPHCERINQRCEASMKAKKSELQLPVSADFCSAKCTGHNCHHAAVEMCRCLKGKGLTNTEIAVFDPEGRTHPLPSPPGNIAHSILTVPHPSSISRDQGYRCVLESQNACTSGKIEEACCYKSQAEFEKLSESSCSLATTGPFKKKRNFKGVTKYADCDNFLVERGSCIPDTVPRLRLPSAKPHKDH